MGASVRQTKIESIVGLDLLRFVSAVFVMLFHLSFWIGIAGTTPNRVSGGDFKFDFATGTTSLGYVGVEIFFVISGFVIAFSAAKADPIAFFRGRILRLMPAAWVCATMTLAVALVYDMRSVTDLTKAWMRSVSFIPVGEQIDGVYWTLGIECSFYLVVLCLISAGKRRLIPYGVAAIGLISVIFNIYSYFGEFRATRITHLLLLSHGCEFALGMVISGLHTRRFGWSWIIVAFALAVGGMFEILNNFPQRHEAPVAIVVWLVAISSIWAACVWNAKISQSMSQWGKAFLRTIGLMTYPLYLLHQLIGAAIMGVLHDLGIDDLISLVIAMSVNLSLAYIVTKMAEPAVRKQLERLFDGVTGKLRLTAA